MRTVVTAIILMALWLLMSGVYKPLIIGLGVASVLLVIFVIKRMDAVDGDRLELRLVPVANVLYSLWLLLEIAKANWAVSKLILAPKIQLRQHLFKVPSSQKSDLGKVVFANSITLTPGTVSVEYEQGHFLVHAVDYSADDNLALADMDRRVTAMDVK